MKTIGLIGGMSWQSTVEYYRWLNQLVQKRLGGSHCAKLLLSNVDFHEIEQRQKAGDWDAAGELLLEHALRLERAGAQAMLIGANTMHKVAPVLEARLSVPLIHVVDATAAAIKRGGGKAPGLLGTRYTMEEAFYRDRLTERHNLGVLIPEADDRALIHRVIYEELQHGVLREESREAFRQIIRHLAAQGADGVILGCTEIPLLIGQRDSPLPTFDTTAIHAEAAVSWALA